MILLGPPEVYYLLYQLDPDFQELFKVKADFAPDMDWNDKHIGDYAAFISRQVREKGLRHFTAELWPESSSTVRGFGRTSACRAVSRRSPMS